MVSLIKAYDYNYTKSCVESSNIPKTSIYLGLFLLTLVLLNDVALILQLVVDNKRIKMGGTGNFHCISTTNIQIYFIKIDMNDLLLTCIPFVQDRKIYLWVFVSNCFWHSDNLHDNTGNSWNHIKLRTWWDTYHTRPSTAGTSRQPFFHRGEHRWELPVIHYHEIMEIYPEPFCWQLPYFSPA